MQQVFSTPQCMKKDFRFTYCPGCDHGVATRLVAELIDESARNSYLSLVAMVHTAQDIEHR